MADGYSSGYPHYNHPPSTLQHDQFDNEPATSAVPRSPWEELPAFHPQSPSSTFQHPAHSANGALTFATPHLPCTASPSLDYNYTHWQGNNLPSAYASSVPLFPGAASSSLGPALQHEYERPIRQHTEHSPEQHKSRGVEEEPARDDLDDESTPQQAPSKPKRRRPKHDARPKPQDEIDKHDRYGRVVPHDAIIKFCRERNINLERLRQKGRAKAGVRLLRSKLP
ncbi:uncharacterized protein RHO25_001304 [Cercospora beticola]|uniref:Uncharacterized protein n=1 Tax=Cercospora beticola TaxID=122368 RepID=A0ABZ0NAX9_CERBT|nr:hypothetical protein RHO25_001304 [Cercospora beticola]